MGFARKGHLITDVPPTLMTPIRRGLWTARLCAGWSHYTQLAVGTPVPGNGQRRTCWEGPSGPVVTPTLPGCVRRLPSVKIRCLWIVTLQEGSLDCVSLSSTPSGPAVWKADWITHSCCLSEGTDSITPHAGSSGAGEVYCMAAVTCKPGLCLGAPEWAASENLQTDSSRRNVTICT